MGQATIDLPDPTQLSGVDAGPLSPEALASADDLLSQLAGDDIDRLLAEADADRPPLAAPVAAVPPPAPVAEIPPLAAAVDSAAVETAAATSPAVDSAAATAAALDAILAPAIESSLKAVEAHVNAVSQTIESATAPAAPSPTLPAELAGALAGTPAVVPSFDALDQKLLNEAAAHVASIMDVPIALPPASVESTTPAQATDTAERQALAEPLVVPHVEKNPSRILSMLVRILELLNSPMAFLPDEVRDAIGKVAILTTCNAAAVIVYVLVFRRPHH